jgi:predicted choloylglycine hydrolase
LKCKEYVETIFPEYLDELQGIATAASLEYESLCAFNLVVQEASNCSILAVNDGNQTFIGRNYDMYYSFKDYLETTHCQPTNGYSSVSHSDIFIGREDGLNGKGFGVAQSGIISYLKPGLSFWVIVRYLLDKCKTVQEGIDFITDIPHYSTMTYLLAENNGNMAIVEVGPNDEYAIREQIRNYLVSTNHYNHPKMQKVKIHIPFDSKTRYDYISKSLGNNKDYIDESILQKILSSHEGLVCSHRDNIGLGTLWSVIYNLNTLDIWRAVGHPCINSYHKDIRLKEV